MEVIWKLKVHWVCRMKRIVQYTSFIHTWLLSEEGKISAFLWGMLCSFTKEESMDMIFCSSSHFLWGLLHYLLLETKGKWSMRENLCPPGGYSNIFLHRKNPFLYVNMWNVFVLHNPWMELAQDTFLLQNNFCMLVCCICYLRTFSSVYISFFKSQNSARNRLGVSS